MGRSLLAVITVVGGILGATSVEFPISTSPGDQLYPDVCWDGEAFWVVWQDEELGTIRGVRVSEGGEFLTDEVEFLNSDTFPGPMCHPAVAAGPDRIFVEARVMLFYNEFGSKTWGIMHNEFSFGGTPILPYPWVLPRGSGYDKETIHASTPCILFGEKYFFSFHRYSKETPIDFHASSVVWGFDFKEGKAYPMWESSEVQLEFFPPVACWDGERFVVLYWGIDMREVIKGAFFSDSIYYKETGGDFSLGLIEYVPLDLLETIKYQALTAGGSGYFFISEIGGYDPDLAHQMTFHILDSTTMLVDSEGVVKFPSNITCYYPDAVFNGENFIALWENRFEDNTVHLYAIEVDTSGNVLDSGYLTFNNPVEQHPTLAFNGQKYLLAWTDNREGEFNIYGIISDTLDLKEGIEEQNPTAPNLSPLIAQPNVFSTTTTLYLSDYTMDEDVTIRIYDNTGTLVRWLVLPKGERAVVWNGNDERGRALSAGVYFVKPEGVKARAAKMVIVR